MMRCCNVGRHPVTNRYTTAVTGTAIMQMAATAGMRDSLCPSSLATTTRVVIRHQSGPISSR